MLLALGSSQNARGRPNCLASSRVGAAHTPIAIEMEIKKR